MESMKSFYRDVLGFTKVFGEMPEADHAAMHQLLRTTTAVHSATMLGHEAAGKEAVYPRCLVKWLSAGLLPQGNCRDRNAIVKKYYRAAPGRLPHP